MTLLNNYVSFHLIKLCITRWKKVFIWLKFLCSSQGHFKHHKYQGYYTSISTGSQFSKDQMIHVASSLLKYRFICTTKKTYWTYATPQHFSLCCGHDLCLKKYLEWIPMKFSYTFKGTTACHNICGKTGWEYEQTILDQPYRNRKWKKRRKGMWATYAISNFLVAT